MPSRAPYAPVPALAALVACAAVAALAAAPRPARATVMQASFSVIGLDRATGAIGVAVLSETPGCGAEVPWVQAGVGAIATQGDVNPAWGPRGLALLRAGVPPQAVCDSLYRSDPGYLRRQVGVLDRDGTPGGYTGLELIGFSAGVIDTTVAVQGTGLNNTNALVVAHEAYLAQGGLPLPEHLLATLAVGAAKSRGPLRSAALLVGRPDAANPGNESAWISLRVDDSADPLGDLARLFRDWAAARLVESHMRFGDQFEKAGAMGQANAERSRARMLLEHALADSTVAPAALNALAWNLALRGVQLEAAQRAIDRALAREPKNRAYLDTAAEVALRRGDRAAARTMARRAAEVAPRDDYLRERAQALEGEGTAGGR